MIRSPEEAEAVTAEAIDRAFRQHPKLLALAEQLYGHVVECIDFDALFGLEQMLWSLVEKAGLGKLDDEGDLSKAMIRRCLVRAAFDPNTAFTDVPFGITKEEAKAANFDPECPFCRYEDEQARTARPAEHDHEDECCSLCDNMAAAWRKEHAEALRRRGLG